MRPLLNEVGKKSCKIKEYSLALHHFLFFNQPLRPGIGDEVLGIAIYNKKYGWPIVKKVVTEDRDGDENIYVNTINRICPVGEWSNRHDLQQRGEQWDYRKFRTHIPHKPSWLDKKTSNIIKGRYAYKENFSQILELYENFKNLKNIRREIYECFALLDKFDKERRGHSMGKDVENNEMVKLKKIEATTKGIRKAIIDELNLLRSGKISLSRARAVSSLASRVLESMRLDMEFQFIYLKKELESLPEMPHELSGKVQL